MLSVANLSKLNYIERSIVKKESFRIIIVQIAGVSL